MALSGTCQSTPRLVSPQDLPTRTRWGWLASSMQAGITEAHSEAMQREDGRGKYRFERLHQVQMFRIGHISVQFNAFWEAWWQVENVNFMPFRLWLKSLMDTCLEHDRLISVFSTSLFLFLFSPRQSPSECSLASTGIQGQAGNGRDVHDETRY